MHIVAKLVRWQGTRTVVEQVAARLNFSNVGVPGLRVHGDHHVDTTAAAVVTLFAYPCFIPGGHTLDIAGEYVAWTHRHAHAHHRFGKQLVGRGRARTVDVGELDDEIVDGFQALHAASLFDTRLPRQPGPACVVLSKNLCISHAPVGHRSAHKPQCRQTSSSLTMMRPVFNSLEI